MNPELPGVNIYITTCRHGVDLRFTPRCYLCKPWPDDSPVWKVTSPGHVHEGEWCALCVEHGASKARGLDWLYIFDKAAGGDGNGTHGQDRFVFNARVKAALEEPTPPRKPAWVGVPDANGDIHCSRLAPQRCMWVEGHYGGCATP